MTNPRSMTLPELLRALADALSDRVSGSGYDFGDEADEVAGALAAEAERRAGEMEAAGKPLIKNWAVRHFDGSAYRVRWSPRGLLVNLGFGDGWEEHEASMDVECADEWDREHGASKP